ncbi:hypothetical protein [Aureispira sp. CCB-E]|uniref:hypothetical protein n=1 Tax=Aureispira sp. CCB-E TaxID=3051121 RepID=UPI002868D4B4|nr:hypothetical protein [Aureispira sp. CCB-E]WMX15907.1 hypothetical protein QP953_05840 [Aureispira sp. CCB-E]
MKKSIFFLLFISIIFTSEAQPCKDLLNEKMDPNDILSLQENLIKLLDCKEYNIDEYDLQKGILGMLLIQLSMEKEEPLTFRDLTKKYDELKSTEEYQKQREIYFKSIELASKKVEIKNWHKDKKLLLELGVEEAECNKIEGFIKESFEKTGEELIITYEELFEAYRKKYPPPTLKDIHPLDDTGYLIENDFEENLIRAKKENKLVLVYFNGFGAINCRKMEENVFISPSIINYLKENFILSVHYVDDRTKLSAEERTKFSKLYGKEITTIGKRNSEFQFIEFNRMSQPHFIIITPEKEKLDQRGYTPDIQIFLEFLENSVEKSKK